jgi:hypothetical protein
MPTFKGDHLMILSRGKNKRIVFSDSSRMRLLGISQAGDIGNPSEVLYSFLHKIVQTYIFRIREAHGLESLCIGYSLALFKNSALVFIPIADV